MHPASNPGDWAHLIDGYNRVPGVADELLDAKGAVRPVWAPFLGHLAGLTPEALATRFARGNQYLRDTGVYYHKYGEHSTAERDWPLSHIPVLIGAADWSEIATGLIQRANLLEAVVADLYGPNRLVADGHLPAQLVAQNPAWLRSMVGTRPVTGHHLHFVAFEVGRGPGGQWWVLGDRTDAPSGAGFALENRVAASRVFPNFYAGAHVHRLAGFFGGFRAALNALHQGADDQIAVLTPGQMNDSYFEHTYLARYLGLLLVEGEDLRVSQGRVMVRTVDGLRPVSVLWRRLDAAFCDPLDLDEGSHLGTPGLAEVARRGGVTMLNALGAGVLETRALMAFLPRISKALTGAPLRLPNIATWWCGQADQQAHVLAQRDRMMIGPAFGTRLPFDDPDATRIGGDPEMDAAWLAAHGAGLVGQEAVTLSTTPVWEDGVLVPRPMNLRVFLARTPTGWSVMPGGYARISPGRDAAAIAMQNGGSVADVWVVDNAPVPRPSLIANLPDDPLADQARDRSLPSRAADNLFWLGRYIERAEGAMRIFRAYHGLLDSGIAADAPLPTFIRNQILELDPKAVATSAEMARAFEMPIGGALQCAARIRDRFSVDGMLALKDLGKAANRLSSRPVPLEETAPSVGVLLRKITGYAGLVHENMYRSIGWRFLSLGTSLERAAAMAGILAAVGAEDAPDGVLDLALELGDSAMSHRARFTTPASAANVADLLALDEANPRSILYHLTRITDHMNHLPGSVRPGAMHPAARLALEIRTATAVHTAHTLTPADLLALRGQIRRLSDLVSDTYMT